MMHNENLISTKKLVTIPEKQRQNNFIRTILKGEFDQAKKLHQGGARLTEADERGLYPLVAAAYSGNPNLVHYIEETLGSQAHTYWAKVDMIIMLENLNRIIPVKRSENATIKWLGEWYERYHGAWWNQEYDDVIEKAEKLEGWYVLWWQRAGKHAALGFVEEKWRKRRVDRRFLGKHQIQDSYYLLWWETLLTYPTPKTHDDYVNTLTVKLTALKEHCLAKIVQAKEELSKELSDAASDEIISDSLQQYQKQITEILEKYVTKDETTEISTEVINQIVQEVSQKVGEKLRDIIDEFLNSQQGQNQTLKLQDEILQQISNREQLLIAELKDVRDKLQEITDKQSPLYSAYENKQKELAEQLALQQPEAVKAFYNCVEKMFTAKLFSAMLLIGEILKREDTKIEKVGNIAANVASGGLGSIPVPVAAGIIGNLVGVGITETVSGIKGHFQEKKYENIADSMIHLNDVIVFAELAARRLTQSFIKFITTEGLTVEQSEAAAKKSVRMLYNFVKTGKLLTIVSLEDKAQALVNDVLEKSKQEKPESAPVKKVKESLKNIKGKMTHTQLQSSSGKGQVFTKILQDADITTTPASQLLISSTTSTQVQASISTQQNIQGQLDCKNTYINVKLELLEKRNEALQKKLLTQNEQIEMLKKQLQGTQTILQTVQAQVSSPTQQSAWEKKPSSGSQYLAVRNKQKQAWRQTSNNSVEDTTRSQRPVSKST